MPETWPVSAEPFSASAAQMVLWITSPCHAPGSHPSLSSSYLSTRLCLCAFLVLHCSGLSPPWNAASAVAWISLPGSHLCPMVLQIAVSRSPWATSPVAPSSLLLEVLKHHTVRATQGSITGSFASSSGFASFGCFARGPCAVWPLPLADVS